MLVELNGDVPFFSHSHNKKLMVLIDRVYQTVLSILNKEARGYITPAEFNQLAVQAQKEMYDDYFFKIGRAAAQKIIDPAIDNIPFDILEKIQEFEFSQNVTPVVVQRGNATQATVQIGGFSPAIYRLGVITSNTVEVRKVTKPLIGNLLKSPLSAPKPDSPIYYRIGGAAGATNDNIRIFGLDINVPELDIFYWRELVDPNWDGETTGGQAVPNTAATDYQNFELHVSEEPELVSLILSYAGVSVRAPEVAQAAGQKAQQISQQQS